MSPPATPTVSNDWPSAQYLDAYYTEAEKTAIATQQLTAQLSTVGLAVPATREAYRQLVEAQDLNTESGRKAYAALLQLSPAFAAIVPATESLADASTGTAAAVQRAAEQMAEAGRRALAGLADQQAELQIELLRAQGQVAAAAELERSNALAKLTEGLSATDAAAATAAFDFNAALRQQIDALNAAKSAAEQAAQAQQAAAQAEAQRVAAIANERAGLEQRLLQQQGDTAALRALELQSLDASNRAILERIFLLQDSQAEEQKAADQARQAIQAAQEAARAEEQRLAAIANQRDGLINRLLQAEGNTAELRARELAGLDESNRVYLERIFAIEDEKAAQQAAAQAAAETQRAAAEAAAEAARQAEQLRQAWQSVSDGIFGEVRRIRGLSGNPATGLATAQRDFAITTAQARAGDQEAARMLPELSRTLLQLAETSATSLLDVERIRAQVAASLEATGSGLASRFGLNVPKLATGTNYVPQDMLAVVHEGEAIVPRRFNPAAGGGADSSALITEVRGLREENKAQALAIVKLQTEITRLLKTWDGSGLPETRATE